LAKAATALGRGRFQLDLPDTRIPEARAIATALEVSAAEIEARLIREREFAAQASHALRTPLTGLRLELDEVLATGEMSDDVRHSLERSLGRLDQLDAVTGELVALARQSSLPGRAEVSMRDLAAQTAQRWSDELAAHGRGLTATTAGELDLTFSPGPVEQILELLLTDVTYRTRGHVRMLHEVGDDGVLRLTVAADQRSSGLPEPAGAPVARARAVAMALGGRLEGDWAEGGYALWIPRR
jgi:signal transduction histidine kinase